LSQANRHFRVNPGLMKVSVWSGLFAFDALSAFDLIS
jgi:hypothetical protein